MKIGFLTLAIGKDFRKAIRVGLDSKRRYCEKWGYDFLLAGDEFESSRPIPWQKIPAILHYLPSYDWIFFSDGDSIIMNYDTKLESFLNDDLVLTFDKENTFDKEHGTDENLAGSITLKTGHMIARNCLWTQKFLKLAYDLQKINPSLNYGNWEQDSIGHLLNINIFDCWEHIATKPIRSFNSLRNFYQEGDFLIHFCGYRGPVDGLQQEMEEWASCHVISE